MFTLLDSKGVPIPGKTYTEVDAAFRSARRLRQKVTVVKVEDGRLVTLGYVGPTTRDPGASSRRTHYAPIPRRHRKRDPHE